MEYGDDNMGSRGQVHILDTGVYLYTHDGAGYLVDTLKIALEKRKRWDDDGYLTRIIFSEMIRDNINETEGYGIGTVQHTDIWKLININCKKQRIEVIDFGEVKFCGSFEEFLTSDINLSV